MTARYLRADPGDARHTFWLHPDEPGHTTPAERAALRRFIADIPDAHEYAQWLVSARPEIAALLINPEHCYRGMARSEAAAKDLRPLGLCEMRARGLTAFAMAVTRALKEIMA